jgi:guanine deaminase
MCLGANYWAPPKIVYYANTRNDAAGIGFDDSMTCDEMIAKIPDRKIPLKNLPVPAASLVFKNWLKDPDKLLY